MKRPEPIELENNLGPDAVTGEINRVPWMAYDVDEMDLYIAEKDAEIAELKEFIENYRFDNKSMLHKIMNQDKKIRMLKRAMWLARAERAKDNAIRYGIYGPAIKSLLWSGVDAKCREKAEEYK